MMTATTIALNTPAPMYAPVTSFEVSTPKSVHPFAIAVSSRFGASQLERHTHPSAPWHAAGFGTWFLLQYSLFHSFLQAAHAVSCSEQ